MLRISTPQHQGTAPMTNRTTILATAKDCITRDRAATHGDAENNFSDIAKLWSWWLGHPVDAYDVAQMMSLFKKARAKANRAHEDNFVDDIGYTALAAEIAAAAPVRAERSEVENPKTNINGIKP
jgi:hypothetical protein